MGPSDIKIKTENESEDDIHDDYINPEVLDQDINNWNHNLGSSAVPKPELKGMDSSRNPSNIIEESNEEVKENEVSNYLEEIKHDSEEKGISRTILRNEELVRGDVVWKIELVSVEDDQDRVITEKDLDRVAGNFDQMKEIIRAMLYVVKTPGSNVKDNLCNQRFLSPFLLPVFDGSDSSRLDIKKLQSEKVRQDRIFKYQHNYDVNRHILTAVEHSVQWLMKTSAENKIDWGNYISAITRQNELVRGYFDLPSCYGIDSVDFLIRDKVDRQRIYPHITPQPLPVAQLQLAVEGSKNNLKRDEDMLKKMERNEVVHNGNDMHKILVKKMKLEKSDIVWKLEIVSMKNHQWSQYMKIREEDFHRAAFHFERSKEMIRAKLYVVKTPKSRSKKDKAILLPVFDRSDSCRLDIKSLKNEKIALDRIFRYQHSSEINEDIINAVELSVQWMMQTNAVNQRRWDTYICGIKRQLDLVREYFELPNRSEINPLYFLIRDNVDRQRRHGHLSSGSHQDPLPRSGDIVKGDEGVKMEVLGSKGRLVKCSSCQAISSTERSFQKHTQENHPQICAADQNTQDNYMEENFKYC